MLNSQNTNDFCSFDDLELDTDIAGFGESLSVYSKTEVQDLYLGISPTHSSDSGVDNIEEFLFDFDNISCYSNDLLETEGSFEDVLIRDTDNTPWLEKQEGNDTVSGFIIPKRSKLQETIDEDHCYTSRVLEHHSPAFTVTNETRSEIQNAKLDDAFSGKATKSVCRGLIEQRDIAKSTYRNDKEMLEEMVLKSTSDRCGNRNAVMARLNRERKKKYVSNLESEVSSLRKHNASLSEENQNLKVSISSCREELAYLRNVLENQSMLSSVITAVSGIKGVNLKGIVNSSSCKNKFEDKQSMPPGKAMAVDSDRSKQPFETESGSWEQNQALLSRKGNGVCLHVQQKNVSIEFCHHCSTHAKSSE